MENSVEVRYAGVVVGRGALREVGADLAAAGTDTAFVAVPEPLPVGTLLTLKLGDAVREARVEDIVESADPAAAGMRVRWGGAAPAASAHFTPAGARVNDEAATTDSGPNGLTSDSRDEGDGAAGSASDGTQQGGKKRRKRR